MSGIKDGEIFVTEGEWVNITYVTGERSRFGEPALGMALGTTQGVEVGSRGDVDGKSEEYWGPSL